ncbi:MAG: GAF domain-containing protein [Rhizobiaceae bacterium]
MKDYWPEFLGALGRMEQPKSVFTVLDKIVQETVGTKLLTVLTYDRTIGRSFRLYSGDENAYPTGGGKEMRTTLFSKTVLDGKKPFSALTIEGIAEVFADHELIRSLGCESCCNIPVVIEGEVAGTMNLLHVKGYYTTERVEQAMELRPYAAVALLLARQHRPQ